MPPVHEANLSGTDDVLVDDGLSLLVQRAHFRLSWLEVQPGRRSQPGQARKGCVL